jgi:hypothetical protein
MSTDQPDLLKLSHDERVAYERAQRFAQTGVLVAYREFSEDQGDPEPVWNKAEAKRFIRKRKLAPDSRKVAEYLDFLLGPDGDLYYTDPYGHDELEAALALALGYVHTHADYYSLVTNHGWLKIQSVYATGAPADFIFEKRRYTQRQLNALWDMALVYKEDGGFDALKMYEAINREIKEVGGAKWGAKVTRVEEFKWEDVVHAVDTLMEGVEADNAPAACQELLRNGSVRIWLLENFGKEDVQELETLAAAVRDDFTLDSFLEALHRYFDQAVPERFEYVGVKVWNPDRLARPLADAILENLEGLREVLQANGLEGLWGSEVKEVLIRLNRPADKTRPGFTSWAFYEKHKQRMVLTHLIATGDGKGRYSGDRGFDAVVHEFGHHIHMSYLPEEAVAFWDAPWKELARAKELTEARYVTFEDREYFYKTLRETGWLLPRALEKVQFDSDVKVPKFLLWLRTPSRQAISQGWHLIESSQDPTLTPLGEDTFTFLRHPEEVTREELPELDRLELHQAAKTRLENTRELMGLSPEDRETNYPLLPADDELTEILRGWPSYEVMVDALGLPSDYAERNKLEGWAETWAAYLLNPAKLSKAARYRLLRTLELAGIFPKAVSRVARSIPATLELFYVGSPLKGERFDVRHVGTGERAQPLGPGLYCVNSLDLAMERAKFVSSPTLYRITAPTAGFFNPLEGVPDDLRESLHRKARELAEERGLEALPNGSQHGPGALGDIVRAVGNDDARDLFVSMGLRGAYEVRSEDGALEVALFDLASLEVTDSRPISPEEIPTHFADGE